jgi:lipoate-protein ligase A
MVAFGKRDVVSEGYAAAVHAARDGGYEAVERLAGGRAAVFHEDTIAFAHAIPDADPRMRVTERFERTARLMTEALTQLGAHARVGEVPGEYCPGAHSVNVCGRRKLMGVGQRLVRGGVHVGGVVVVDGAEPLRAILVAVYEELGLAFSPDTAGSLAAEVGRLEWAEAAGAIVDVYARHYELEPAALDDETLDLAGRLAPEHVPSLSARVL